MWRRGGYKQKKKEKFACEKSTQTNAKRRNSVEETNETNFATNQSIAYFFGRLPVSRLPLRALDKTYGLVLECLAPGAGPKCLNTLRHLVGPRKNKVWRPVGAAKASWSNVKQRPPAFRMRARAVRVKRRAATVILGTLNRRTSSVTVATVTTIFFSRSSAGKSGLFNRRAYKSEKKRKEKKIKIMTIGLPTNQCCRRRCIQGVSVWN